MRNTQKNPEVDDFFDKIRKIWINFSTKDLL